MKLDVTSISNMLLNKAVEPLDEIDLKEIQRIQNLEISGFSEADVRAEIIDPIIRILGYRKGLFSSVSREKHIGFADKKKKYIDYNFTLWETNFWLIEAKKPKKNKSFFGYQELSQAVEYAIHPEINAALVLLCDGYKLELFDREKDLINPILRFLVSDLDQQFDNLRKILSPINVWFFYKRRVLEAIDKAFKHEVNQGRINEFGRIIGQRLTEKRAEVLENFRALKLNDSKQHSSQISSASVDEIVDIHFFYPQSTTDGISMIENLLKHFSHGRNFSVLSKIIPYDIRDANDYYYMYLLWFLMRLEKIAPRQPHLPNWISYEADKESVEEAIKRIIGLCLTYFSDDEPRKVILLASNTFRRIIKILTVVRPEITKSATLKHLITRYSAPELSWEQILSSPKHHTLFEWDKLNIIATEDFVSRHKSKKNDFNTNLAKQELENLWEFERALLSFHVNYKLILDEYDFGEIHPTQASAVVYDNLGHACLCVIKRYPEWKEYVLSKHLKDVKLLANMRSWAALEILGKDTYKPIKVSDAILSERFFLGKMKITSDLKRLYGYSKPKAKPSK